MARTVLSMKEFSGSNELEIWEARDASSLNWKIFKSGWYTAAITVDYNQIPEVEKWLEENIEGYKKHTIYRFVWANSQKGEVNLDIKFRKEKDYLLFVLTWQ
jgi:hypothetical protein